MTPDEKMSYDEATKRLREIYRKVIRRTPEDQLTMYIVTAEKWDEDFLFVVKEKLLKIKNNETIHPLYQS